MKRSEGAYGLGIISIFLIFAVLCLTVFATLAVSSARADLRLSEKNADYVRKYYAATVKCAEFVRSAAAAYPLAEAPGIVEGDRVNYDMAFQIDENISLHAAFYITAAGKYEYTVFEVVGASASATESAVRVWQP